ncbi:MAG: Ppx/GppA family phosphatase [Acetobacteraceae bacterium]|nr:Ppx/GppA family phosphatase [Acetobacteraceae bacterium]
MAGQELTHEEVGGLPDRDSNRAQRDKPEHYAVVDIGSNSVRLVVYDQLGRVPFPRFNEKSLPRLGDGLVETGEISTEGFRRTIEALRRFRAVADAMGVGRIDVLATEAIRRAANGGRLVARIAEEAGLETRVLSGDEEAHYASLGVVAGFHRPTGLVGDMGGGSLEMAEIRDGRVGNQSVSLPLGALPVGALLGRDGTSARHGLDSVLSQSLPRDWSQPVFYAVGGGWRALARVHMESVAAPVHVAHGYALDATEARDFAKRIWRTPEAKLKAMPGVPSRRAATLPAAALLMDRLLKRLAPERVVFSALGLREGWLYGQLPPEDQALDPLVEGARIYGTPLARNPAMPSALMRWTDNLWPDETQEERRLRVAACAISDIAWRDHPSVQAAESFRRLLQFPFVGIEHEERVFLSAVIHARYAGSERDPALRPAIKLLDRPQRQRALLLGRVLLLGYRVSGSVPEILGSARLRIGGDAVRLEVGKAARVPDSEVVANRLNLVASAAGVRRVSVIEVG